MIRAQNTLYELCPEKKLCFWVEKSSYGQFGIIDKARRICYTFIGKQKGGDYIECDNL